MSDDNIKRTPGIWWLILITSILLAAHYSRAGEIGWMLGSILMPLILLWKERWTWQVMSVFLAYGGFEWMMTIYGIAIVRIQTGQDWMRMALILSSVVILTLFSAFKAYRYQKKLPDAADSPARFSSTAFISTFALLSIIQLKAPLNMLLLDRFFPGFGALEIFFISYYAGWLTGKILPKKETAAWRFRLWIIFTIIFFSQFVLGLSVSDLFMQTGVVHLPIPAVIVGGPLFRGDGFFMVILLFSTILLAGPSWCSYLCYVGALDQYFSNKKKKAKALPMKWRQNLRLGILLLTVILGISLNLLGVSSLIASVITIAFALVSIAVMMWHSSHAGIMIHCTSVCPVGWITTLFGRINPFRVKINDSCTDCGACTLACRYGSLNPIDIKERQPNISCTLCGDCIGSCPHDSLEYNFVKMKTENARYAFIVLVVTLHSIFLAIARV